MDHLAIAKLLDTYRPQVIDQTVILAMQNPFWEERFGSAFSERLALDCDLNLAVLAKAIRYRSPMIFDDHLIWRRNQVIGFGCATGHVRSVFACKWAAISAVLPAEAHPTIYDYIASGMQALAYPSAAPREIAAHHDALAEALTAETFDQSWHWQAAYQVGGRAAALQENWFLIDYALDAIGMHNPDLLGKYVRNQRNRMRADGLSTVHMQQALWVAAQAAEHLLAPAAAAELRRTLETAAGYLAHDSESCHALLAAQDQIVSEVAEALTHAGLATQPEQAAMEVGWYLAYLTDGVAVGDPSGLVSYTRWMQQYFASRGLPDTPVRQCYTALSGAVERHLPQYAVNDARTILSAAQRVL
jgi:hypothetical protein